MVCCPASEVSTEEDPRQTGDETAEVNAPASGGGSSHIKPEKNRRFPDGLEFNMHWSGLDSTQEEDDPGRTSTLALLGADEGGRKAIGRCSLFTFGFTETYLHEVDEGSNLYPSPKRPSRAWNLGEGANTRMCKKDRAFDAYRRALELVDFFGYKRPTRGYPVWWRTKDQVVAYLPRDDEHHHVDEDAEVSPPNGIRSGS